MTRVLILILSVLLCTTSLNATPFQMTMQPTYYGTSSAAPSSGFRSTSAMHTSTYNSVQALDERGFAQNPYRHSIGAKLYGSRSLDTDEEDEIVGEITNSTPIGDIFLPLLLFVGCVGWGIGRKQQAKKQA